MGGGGKEEGQVRYDTKRYDSVGASLYVLYRIMASCAECMLDLAIKAMHIHINAMNKHAISKYKVKSRFHPVKRHILMLRKMF